MQVFPSAMNSSILRSTIISGKIPLFLFFMLISLSAQAQDSTISKILITGNETTKDNVILRELLVKVGEKPDPALIEESRQRLLNLFLFNRVEISVLPLDQGLLLLIEVTERLYLFPFPIFAIHDRDWGKLSYGFSLANINFRGQAEKLALSAWFGYRSGFAFDYSDQWMGDSLHMTSNLKGGKFTTSHRTLDFEERHYFAEAAIGKWWTLKFKTELRFLYDHIAIDEKYAPLLHSGSNSEHTFGVQLFIRHDTRDLYAFPSSGWSNRVKIWRYGLFENYNNYTRVNIDLRHYEKHFGIIFAARLYQSYLFGQVPIYRKNYFGFGERIRGHFDTVQEGRHINSASFEVRFPILPTRHYSYKVPYLPEMYTKNLPFGISGGLFADAGLLWNHAQEYRMQRVLSGFGADLFLHVPYVEVVRFELAFNTQFDSEFIFEIGVAF